MSNDSSCARPAKCPSPAVGDCGDRPATAFELGHLPNAGQIRVSEPGTLQNASSSNRMSLGQSAIWAKASKCSLSIVNPREVVESAGKICRRRLRRRACGRVKSVGQTRRRFPKLHRRTASRKVWAMPLSTSSSIVQIITHTAVLLDSADRCAAQPGDTAGDVTDQDNRQRLPILRRPRSPAIASVHRQGNTQGTGGTA